MNTKEKTWLTLWIVEAAICVLLCIAGIILYAIPSVPDIATKICTWVAIILVCDCNFISGIFYGIRYHKAISKGENK